MDAYEAIVKKRDRRHFLAEPVPDEILQRILQAGRMAGSSKNAQPNRFVVVRAPDLIAKLAELSPLGRWVGTAPLVVVIVQEGRPHSFDAGRAAQNMMVAAFAEGVGSCPAHLPEEPLGELLGVPADLTVERVLAFGYVDPERDSPPPAVAGKRLALEEIVHWDRW